MGGAIIMPSYKKCPEEGEYVLITVKSVNPNSAFADLDEYQGLSGMIHISEVASTWVRSIRDFVSVGKKTVAKVTAIDPSRGYINLSIKRVSPSVRRAKITESRNEKKADNLLGFVAEDIGKTKEEAYKVCGFEMQKKFGTLYSAFEAAAEFGATELEKEGIDSVWAKKIEGFAKKNIKPKEVSITGKLIIRSYASDGINVIKKALTSNVTKGVKVSYFGAPKYHIEAVAKNYIDCEKSINTVNSKIIDAITKAGGEAEFVRDKA
ncbi:MAG: translation initiation factor IF-2 subunit alpha [Candidatus Aenigmarchaeota archaeon]|nr:translation initiation factor IF-2 subunit alpha [Candidatus Aenigmarchaeota archaeon]